MCNSIDYYVGMSDCGGTTILEVRRKQYWNQISIGIAFIDFQFNSGLFYIFWRPIKDISLIIMMIVEIVTLCTKDWGLRENLYHLNNADIKTERQQVIVYFQPVLSKLSTTKYAAAFVAFKL